MKAQFGFTVSKKNFKRAVDRNRIKRVMREAVRLHKHELDQNDGMDLDSFAFMILYVGNELPEFKVIEPKIISLFDRFKKAQNEIY